MFRGVTLKGLHGLLVKTMLLTAWSIRHNDITAECYCRWDRAQERLYVTDAKRRCCLYRQNHRHGKHQIVSVYFPSVSFRKTDPKRFTILSNLTKVISYFWPAVICAMPVESTEVIVRIPSSSTFSQFYQFHFLL